MNTFLHTFGAVMGFISAALFCLAAYRYVVIAGKEKNRLVLQGLVAYAAHLVSLVVLALLLSRFQTVGQFAVAFSAPVVLLIACAYFGYRADTVGGRRLLVASAFLLVSYIVAFGVPRLAG